MGLLSDFRDAAAVVLDSWAEVELVAPNTHWEPTDPSSDPSAPSEVLVWTTTGDRQERITAGQTEILRGELAFSLWTQLYGTDELARQRMDSLLSAFRGATTATTAFLDLQEIDEFPEGGWYVREFFLNYIYQGELVVGAGRKYTQASHGFTAGDVQKVLYQTGGAWATAPAASGSDATIYEPIGLLLSVPDANTLVVADEEAVLSITISGASVGDRMYLSQATAGLVVTGSLPTTGLRVDLGVILPSGRPHWRPRRPEFV